jgi:hypothetical protein
MTQSLVSGALFRRLRARHAYLSWYTRKLKALFILRTPPNGR